MGQGAILSGNVPAGLKEGKPEVGRAELRGNHRSQGDSVLGLVGGGWWCICRLV